MQLRHIWYVGSAWVAAQLNWLLWAYLLEIKGSSVFLVVWTSAAAFFVTSALLAQQLTVAFRPSCTFQIGCEQPHHSKATPN